MTNQITKEQLIRIKILPQLEGLCDNLFDLNEELVRPYVRKLDRITEELITILNDET